MFLAKISVLNVFSFAQRGAWCVPVLVGPRQGNQQLHWGYTRILCGRTAFNGVLLQAECQAASFHIIPPSPTLYCNFVGDNFQLSRLLQQTRGLSKTRKHVNKTRRKCECLWTLHLLPKQCLEWLVYSDQFFCMSQFQSKMNVYCRVVTL
jgi:hypothetical protein